MQKLKDYLRYGIWWEFVLKATGIWVAIILIASTMVWGFFFYPGILCWTLGVALGLLVFIVVSGLIATELG